MNHYNKVRPLVYVGNMMDQVDAIRYYSQLLDDLNEAVRKEQEVANQLAVQSDNLSGQTAYEVIEKFLHVSVSTSLRLIPRPFLLIAIVLVCPCEHLFDGFKFLGY
jgi:hypothetical protein